MLGKIAALGKLAAKKSCGKSSKRRGSQSKLYKVKTEADKKEVRNAMNESTGNAQSPHRYGRKKG
jgi:hypothetical protein